MGASLKAAHRFQSLPLTEAEVRLQIGSTYYRMSLFDDAVREHTRALELLEPLQDVAAARPLRTLLQLKLAGSLADLNKLPQARALLQQAGADPALDPVDPLDPLSAAFAQARLKLARGAEKIPVALQHAARLATLSDTAPGDDKESQFAARYLLGHTLFLSNRLEAAEAVFDDLLGPQFGSASVGPVQLARARIVRARIRTALGREDGVEEDLLQGRDALRTLMGPKEQAVASSTADLAALYERRGDFVKAAQAFREAYAAYVVSLGAERSSARITLLNLAITESNLGQWASALDTLEAGRPWFVANMGGEGSPVVQAIDYERSRALNGLGRGEQALRLLDTLDAQRLAEATPAKDWVWRLQAERGRAMLASGHTQQGLQALRAALVGGQASGTPAWMQEAWRKSIAQAPAQQAASTR
jgi:tetratricopeptide (TPR) repeat protein